jgi:radical SAM protein with 4Fe4S-binding SPASM domain
LNTLVTAETAGELLALYRLAQSMALMRWSLFFLVAMGRGQALRELSPADAESVMEWVYAISHEAPFAIAATEAPHFRRVALVHMRAAGLVGDQIRATPIGRGFGIRDGNGVMFISHRGEIAPAGFLPVVTGNVRNASLVDLYRRHHVFTALRDVTQLRGKCGRCEYRSICGGSRARAYAHTGDYLASDPLCVYEP